MENLHIVSATDKNYAMPLSVMLTSLVENKASRNKLYFYILDGGISEDQRAIFYEISKKYHIDISFMPVNQNVFHDCYISGHITHSAYYRIIIPDLLSKSIKKVIYLDSDLIIKKDISDLWDIDISNYHLAAAEDPAGLWERSEPLIPEKSKYFNSGVMLINLQRWRQDNTLNKILEFIKDNNTKIKLWDQDGLNAILYDKWLQIDPKWNVQSNYYYSFFGDKYMEAKKDPYIIHFTTPTKPWHSDYMDTNLLKNHFDYYLSKIHPNHPISNYKTLYEGKIMKGSGKAVYLIVNGCKRHIVSRKVFEELGFSFEDVNKVSDEVIESIPTGRKIDHVSWEVEMD